MPACARTARDLEPGSYGITVTIEGVEGTFDVTAGQPAGDGSPGSLWLVVAADGSVTQTTHLDAPASPYCGA